MSDLNDEERLVLLDALLLYAETDDPDPDVQRGCEVALGLHERLKEEWDV